MSYGHSYESPEGVSITSDDLGIDEIATRKPVMVHIERMSDGQVWMRIGDVMFSFFTREGGDGHRAPIYANAYEPVDFGAFGSADFSSEKIEFSYPEDK